MDSQSKQVSEYANRLGDYDKKFEENSRKFGTLLTVRFHTYIILCDIHTSSIPKKGYSLA